MSTTTPEGRQALVDAPPENVDEGEDLPKALRNRTKPVSCRLPRPSAFGGRISESAFVSNRYQLDPRSKLHLPVRTSANGRHLGTPQVLDKSVTDSLKLPVRNITTEIWHAHRAQDHQDCHTVSNSTSVNPYLRITLSSTNRLSSREST